MSHINHHIKAEIDRKIAAGEYGESHWWCDDCGQVTELNADAEMAQCAICHRTHVRPVTEKKGIQKSEVRSQNGTGPEMKTGSSRMWFAAMRALVDNAPDPKPN